MGRSVYRAGMTSLMTAEQLAVNLAVPLYRVVTGTAKTGFPLSGIANPSRFVVIQGNGRQPNEPFEWVARLPIVVNDLQWEKVIVPVLKDPRVSSWSGVLRANGKPVYLSTTVLVPGSQDVAKTTSGKELTQGAYIGQEGVTDVSTTRLLSSLEFVKLLASLIKEQAGRV